MKVILLTVLMALSFSASVKADIIDRHVFVGVKRKLKLRKIGGSGAAYAFYANLRITNHGGNPVGRPHIIFPNVYEANPQDPNSRFNVMIGYRTRGLPVATGSIRSFRLPRVETESFDFSGMKKDLFGMVFKIMNQNRANKTGEVRVEVYSSTLYTIKCRVHMINK